MGKVDDINEVTESENKRPVSFMSMLSADFQNVAELDFAKLINPKEHN